MQIHSMGGIYQSVVGVKKTEPTEQTQQTSTAAREKISNESIQYDPRYIRPSELRALGENMLDSGRISFDEYTTMFMSTLEFTIDERGQAHSQMKPDEPQNYHQIYKESQAFHASRGDAQAAARYQNILGLFDKIIHGTLSTRVDTTA